MSNYRKYNLDALAGMFKALSSPHRLAILLRLVECCGAGKACGPDEEMSACVGELGRDLGIVPSTVSHHIKELRQAGLIRLQRRGQHVLCRVDADVLRALADFLSGQGI